ncbi:hypothetical protein VTP01DRAFT_8725 [Rhizomucor pusillus]|uniref:uncharacterized protein n=1 Tax=Rhizomucor pusillus TaxID=4840 RepID=UPI0037446C48
MEWRAHEHKIFFVTIGTPNPKTKGLQLQFVWQPGHYIAKFSAFFRRVPQVQSSSADLDEAKRNPDASHRVINKVLPQWCRSTFFHSFGHLDIVLFHLLAYRSAIQ